MKQYEVVPSRRWQHTSGRTASLYGAVPWTTSADKPNWEIITMGWTVRDNRLNTIGISRQPYATRAEAEQAAERMNGPAAREFYVS